MNERDRFPLKLPPPDTEFGRLLHEVREHLLAQNTHAAMQALKRAERKAPPNPDAYTTIGWLWMQFHKPRAAAGAFRKALSHDKEHAPAHHGLGRAYQEIGLFPLAEKHLRQAHAIDPDFPLYEADLGTFYFNLGRIKEAEPHLRRAIALAEDDAQSHALLGYIAYLRDNLAEALFHFERAIHYEPENPGHYNNLGFLYLMEGNVEKAREQFEEALRLRPRFIRALYNRALLHWLEGEQEAAAEMYARAREMDGGGQEFREHQQDLEELWQAAALPAMHQERLKELLKRLQAGGKG